MKRTRSALVLAVAAIGGLLGIPTAQSSQPGAYGPSGGLNFICGLQAAEDLVLVPGARWRIAGGMGAGSGLRLIDTQSKTVRTLFGAGVSTTRADKTRFAGLDLFVHSVPL